MSNNYHSFHIFMFPFRIELKNESNFMGIKEELKSIGWIEIPTDDFSVDYNEKKFYHELAHPCLFPDSPSSMIHKYIFKVLRNNAYL